MTVEITPEVLGRIKGAYYAWFTTVREDGMPQPTPVWFIFENNEFLIYSMPHAQKVKNILSNPQVSLSFSEDEHGESFVVIMGNAVIDANMPPVSQQSAYLAKYDEGITRIGFTRDGMSAQFSTAIRVRPGRIRAQ
jgi:PPOX class probable F420-dependent enzyme